MRLTERDTRMFDHLAENVMGYKPVCRDGHRYFIRSDGQVEVAVDFYLDEWQQSPNLPALFRPDIDANDALRLLERTAVRMEQKTDKAGTSWHGKVWRERDSEHPGFWTTVVVHPNFCAAACLACAQATGFEE